MMNKNGKIIFFDIDGTVWDWNETVPDSTKEAIGILINNGHIPVICSGRAKAHLMNEALSDMGFRDMVAACGNYVVADGSVIYERYIGDETIKKIIELADLCRIPIVLEGANKHWVSEKGFEQDDFVDKMYKSMGDSAVRGLRFTPDMRVNKAAGDILNCSDYATFKNALSDEFDFIEHGLALNVNQNPGLEDNAITAVFEFVPKGTHKAFGINKYCEYRQVDPRDAIAFGDSVNDIEMLQCVGYGVAMGNGTQEIKEIANYVTDDIHKDGVYKALKYLKLI